MRRSSIRKDADLFRVTHSFGPFLQSGTWMPDLERDRLEPALLLPASFSLRPPFFFMRLVGGPTSSLSLEAMISVSSQGACEFFLYRSFVVQLLH